MKWSNLVEKLVGHNTTVTGTWTWTFRTNIMCDNCIAKVKPILDDTVGITSWTVDLKNPDRLLTVVSEGISKDKIMTLVRSAGFIIESC